MALTLTGLTVLTADEIKTEIEDAFKTTFGSSIDLDPSGPFGQIIGIMAERESSLWESVEDVKESFNPEGAVGARLDELCALTGTSRLPASSSTVGVLLLGDNSTLIPANTEVSVDSTEAVFQTDSAVVLSTTSAWSGSINYTSGEVVLNGGNQYICTSAGVSASSGGPTGTSIAITDGTVTWRYVGSEAAHAKVNCSAELAGPTRALAYDLNTIDTPVSGLNSVTNPLDAIIGRNVETDAELRERRELELIRGDGTYDSLYSALFLLPGVELVSIYENSTPDVDAYGNPPNSVDALVVGGEDADIAQAIFDKKALGVSTGGNTSVPLSNDYGPDVTINFSRPDEVDIYIALEIIYSAADYPADGDTQLLTKVTGLSTAPGKNCTSSRVVAACFEVDGVLEAVAYIGTSASPSTTTTIQIDPREVASYDSSRVTINKTPGTP